MNTFRPSALRLALGAFVLASAAAATPASAAHDTTSRFEGVKADQGTASATTDGGQLVLSLSSDFKVPDTPAPHWQVVDSKGNVHLLNRLVIKGDKYNQTITLPPHVQDVAKVQIWCAWAEVLLGEASFRAPVKR